MQNPKLKKYLFFAARIAVSVVILGVILRKIDIAPIKSILPGVNIPLYLAAFAILLLQQYIFVFSWKACLASNGHIFKAGSLYQAVLIGIFFGTFLPASFGGDLVLTFNIGRSISRKHDALSSLLFIRLFSVFISLAISVIFLSRIPSLFPIRIFMAGIICLMVLLYAFAVHKTTGRLIKKVLSWAKDHPIVSFIDKTYTSFSEYGNNYSSALKIFLIMIVCGILRISIDYTVALSIGADIPFSYFLAITPIVSLITIIPVSIAGLGIREGAYIALLGAAGVPAAISFSISILIFTLNMWLFALGGVIYAVKGSKITRHEQS